MSHGSADPDRFDITRRLQLARAEAGIAFERILIRYPDIRLAVDPSRIVWRKRIGIRALASLPVRLR